MANFKWWVDQFPKLFFNLVDQYLLLFFWECQILSQRRFEFDSLALLFPISKIHSKQNDLTIVTGHPV